MRTLHDTIKDRDFAFIGQLRLQQDDSREEVIRQAELLSPVVDAIAVTDNPRGSVHMSGLAAAALVMRQGLDPVLHIGARDRNRIALKSELLGAAALGVTSLLLQRGDKLPKDRRPKIRQYFDTGSKFLLATASQLSDFEVARGNRELYLGTMIKVFDPADDWQPSELTAKLDSGARFVQTQTCLNIDLLQRYMAVLVAHQVTWRCQIFVSVPVVTSLDAARWLADNTRGAVIPDDLVDRFKGAGDPEAVGVDYCAEIIRRLRQIPGIGGINLTTSGPVEAIVAAIDQATGGSGGAGTRSETAQA